jgi:hypothetical protein
MEAKATFREDDFTGLGPTDDSIDTATSQGNITGVHSGHMDALQVAPYLRAAVLAAALTSICVGLWWGIGRLGRDLGNVWWLRWGPKLAYAVMLAIVFPAFFTVHFGPHGLLVYLLIGGFLSIAVLFAALYRTT